MAQLNFNAATVAPSKPLDPIPSGWYRAIIEKSEMTPTKDQQGQMLALELKIIDGEFVGRKVFDRLNLVNANPTTVQIAYEQLSAIGHATGVIQIADSQQLHNIPLLVKVKLRPAGPGGDGKHYDASNEVKGYDNINADRQVGPSGPVTAGGIAGAPVGTPPWGAQQAAPAAAPAYPQPAAPAAPVAPQAAFPAPVQQPPQQFVPPAAAQPWQQPAAAAPAPAAIPAQPFAPPAPVAAPPAGPVMLPAAQGVPYEAYKAQGWTDELLIQHGMMAPPVAAPAPVAPVAPAAPVAPQPPQQSFAPPQAAPAAPGGMAPPWAQRPAG